MARLGRLKRRPEFLRVASGRRKWVTPGLILQALPREGEGCDDGIRFGITVSRKVGGAVDRNRARRRLHAAAREVLPQVGRPGCDYVLIGRATTPHRPYAELCADLRAAVERLDRGARSRRAKAEGGAAPAGAEREAGS